jgi:glycine dehydrogenase subunit 1
LRYIPHTDDEIRHMLSVVGVPTVDALFEAIPESLRLKGSLSLPEALSEQEIGEQLRGLAERNASSATHDWFLGAGAYAHFTPSVVDAIASRSEFYTAYTPYQAEFSQGTLQTIFEWQTLVCALTGLEVANASLYDGASATAEAILMAMRITKRSRVVVAAGLHPQWLEVVRTYLSGIESELVVAPRTPSGRSAVAASIDSETACVVVQQPNFWGCIEPLAVVAEAAHSEGALSVATVSEALSLALLRAPGDCGADLVCGEAQSFGVPISFGGPALGFLAARQRHVRQMPGRLCGETLDEQGRRGFVLTLSTREQHIRREKATSNICTNQGLCLLMATVYLALMGRRGLRKLAECNFAKAEYAKSRVRETPGLSLLFDVPSFNEFAVRVPDSADAALARALRAGAIGGFDLSRSDPELAPALLMCTTELCSAAAIDRTISALAAVPR